MGQQCRGTGTGFSRLAHGRRLQPSRRHDSPVDRCRPAVRKIGDGSCPGDRHSLRDSGGSGEGHRPAQPRDRPCRPPGTRRRGGAGNPSGPPPGSDLSGGAAGGASLLFHPPVPEGRNLQLEGLRAGPYREGCGGGGGPGDAGRGKPLAHLRRG